MCVGNKRVKSSVCFSIEARDDESENYGLTRREKKKWGAQIWEIHNLIPSGHRVLKEKEKLQMTQKFKSM